MNSLSSGMRPFYPGERPKEKIKVPLLTPLSLDILTGENLIYCSPNHQTHTSGSLFGTGTNTTQYVREESRVCCISPAGYRAVDSDFAPALDINVRRPPVGITESLAHLRRDFPDSNRLAFIMMQFDETPAIRRSFQVFGRRWSCTG